MNIHEKALTLFNKVRNNEYEERLRQQSDRLFMIPGSMWSYDYKEQFKNKPKPEVNKLELALTRIKNEYRNNRFEAKFISKDGTKDKLADSLNDLYRSFKSESNSSEAYDNAFDNAISGGIGAWRLKTIDKDDSDEENEEQIIINEPIFDPETSVYFVGSSRADKKDAIGCFVLSEMDRVVYEELYDDDVSSWPKVIGVDGFQWTTEDTVIIAEYYEVNVKKKDVYIYRGLDDSFPVKRYQKDELTDEIKQQLESTGYKLSRIKKVKKRVINKYILSYSKILEDCGIIAGEYIPIVLCYGKRVVVNGLEVSYGHVRPNRDIAMVYNTQYSKVMELSSLSSIEKPIVTPEQINGHEEMWSDDNVKNFPYLLINPVTDINGQVSPLPPVGYTRPPQIPPATAALLQMASQDYNDMLGNQSLGEKVESNMSGKAYNAVQNRLDMQSYIYMNEFEKALEWEAKIWLSMAKDIYVEEGRQLKTMDTLGNYDTMTLKAPNLDKNGGLVIDNDLSKANFDVVVKIGAATSTRREATVQAITPIIPLVQDPSDQAVLIGTAIANLDGEGLDEIKEYNRKKMVKMGISKPNDDDIKEAEAMAQQGQQKDANTIYLESAAQEAEAKAAQARADTMVKLANAEKIKADTQKVLVETDVLSKTPINDANTKIIDNQPQPQSQQSQQQPKPQPVNVTVNLPAITINNNEQETNKGGKIKETKDIEKEKDTIINITMPEMQFNQPDVIVNNNVTIENEESSNETNEETNEETSKETNQTNERLPERIDIKYDKSGKIIGAISTPISKNEVE